MSQVNYVQQVNLFMEYARRNRLTSHERVFFFALFHVANTWAQRAENHEWPDVFFQVSNSEIHEWSDLEERAIRTVRNSLKQRGLIDFRKGDGKRSDPEYKINYLQLIGYKIAPVDVGESSNNGCKIAADSAGGYVGGHVGDCVGDDVCGTVSEGNTTGYKIAADHAGGAYTPSYPRNSNININREPVNVSEKARGKAGEGQRGQARERTEPFSFAGLIDTEAAPMQMDGLIPLAAPLRR